MAEFLNKTFRPLNVKGRKFLWGKKLHIPHSQKPHRAQPAPSQVPYIHMPTWRPADEDRDEDFVKLDFEGVLGQLMMGTVDLFLRR